MIIEDSDIEKWIKGTDPDTAAGFIYEALPQFQMCEAFLIAFFKHFPDDWQRSISETLSDIVAPKETP